MSFRFPDPSPDAFDKLQADLRRSGIPGKDPNLGRTPEEVASQRGGSGDDLLYKVAAPRPDLTFEPSQFWRTDDWSSSTTAERAGYLPDSLLYAGNFDEVTIHLLPPVPRFRLWRSSRVRQLLAEFDIDYPPQARAVMVVATSSRPEVDAFEPTIYTFDREGFERVRNGEYVSREPRTAIGVETLSMREALERWQIQVVSTDDYQRLKERATSVGIEFDEQT